MSTRRSARPLVRPRRPSANTPKKPTAPKAHTPTPASTEQVPTTPTHAQAQVPSKTKDASKKKTKPKSRSVKKRDREAIMSTSNTRYVAENKAILKRIEKDQKLLRKKQVAHARDLERRLVHHARDMLSHDYLIVDEFKRTFKNTLRYQALGDAQALADAIEKTNAVVEEYNEAILSYEGPDEEAPEMPQPEPCQGGVLVLQHKVPVTTTRDMPRFIPRTMVIRLIIYPSMTLVSRDQHGDIHQETIEPVCEFLLETFDECEDDPEIGVRLKPNSKKPITQMDVVLERKLRTPLTGDLTHILNYFRTNDNSDGKPSAYNTPLNSFAAESVCKQIAHHLALYFAWLATELDNRIVGDGVISPRISALQIWDHFRAYDFMVSPLDDGDTNSIESVQTLPESSPETPQKRHKASSPTEQDAFGEGTEASGDDDDDDEDEDDDDDGLQPMDSDDDVAEGGSGDEDAYGAFDEDAFKITA